MTSDEGSDFQRLGTLDPATGRFTAVAPEPRWDVESFDISDDGRFIAYIVNEAGISRLKLLDIAHPPAAAPSPACRSERWAGSRSRPGATSRSAVTSRPLARRRLCRQPADASPSPAGPRARPAASIPRRNVEPVLVETTSFDGEKVSGFLYRPDPARFPGRRPLIMSIHGGPEGQSRPGFLGRNNYLLNELGIALFYPERPRLDRLRQALRRARQRPRPSREQRSRTSAPSSTSSPSDPAARSGPLRRDRRKLWRLYVLCQRDPLRRPLRRRIASSPSPTSSPSSKIPSPIAAICRRVEYGDERDPAQRRKLLAISPLTRVKELGCPLMVQTGGNDPRVPASEAEQSVKAVAPERRHRLAPARPGRGPRLRQEGQPGLCLLDQPDVLAAQPAGERAAGRGIGRRTRHRHPERVSGSRPSFGLASGRGTCASCNPRRRRRQFLREGATAQEARRESPFSTSRFAPLRLLSKAGPAGRRRVAEGAMRQPRGGSALDPEPSSG